MKIIDVEVISHVDSIMNPISGTIKVQSVGELIMDETKIDPHATQIITNDAFCFPRKNKRMCL